MKTRIVTVTLGALLLAAISGQAETLELVNGLWLRPSGFEARLVYSVDGRLTEKPPASVDRTIDLAGGYVVPPYGEAHNHNIMRPARVGDLERYVEQGVFYVLIQNNVVLGEDGSAAHPVEVAYANPGLTAAGGHLVEVNERLHGYGVFGDLPKSELDGYAHFVIESEADLTARWPAILAARPDLIKIFLGFTGEDRPAGTFYGKRGLAPGLVPAIVERAHAANLRVSAHLETVADFRLALASGVDMLAHVPGWRVGEEAGFETLDMGRWLLTEDDARRAAAAGVAVVTASLAGEAMQQPEHPHHAVARELHARNLRLLHEAGVRLVIGSDFYGGTSLVEAHMLGTTPIFETDLVPLGVFDNETIVRMLAEATPRAIFPGRDIGGLGEGYEASFLVLEGDPIADLANLRRIRMRFSRGKPVE